MSANRSLRNRVAVTLAVFGGVVSLVLAVIIHLASQDLERRLIDETLTAELDDYVARRARNPQSLPERTATIRAFVVSPGLTHSSVPEAVAALLPGKHPLVLDGTPYRAAVREVGTQRFVVLYDVSALKRRERGFLLLLAGSVVLITVVSALAGRWLAGRTIAPVTELVQRVAERSPEADAPPPLADAFPWQEVQQLAADFDSYLIRLHDFIERERLFTGDVSHELRTPLAVIKGATELLLDDPNLDPRNQQRVARIGRAVAEMGEISGALLALAREQDGAPVNSGRCDAEAVAVELIERYQTLVRSKALKLTLKVDAKPQLKADHAVLAMVMGNLLRNALNFTQSGEVCLRLGTDSIQVEDTGQGVDENHIPQLFKPYVRGDNSQGAGLGLSLVQRLCERQGWEVSLSNRASGGTVALLQLQPQAGRPPNE
ncbi:MAG: HAMP domain-containing sensor histidine kinase [Candidatus Thiodiazotropha sp.]